MTAGRPGRGGAATGSRVAPAVLLTACLLTACGRAVDGVPTAAPPSDRPSSPQELEELVVRDVPSGLPRLPDDELEPPAGAKRLEDVAAYAPDPERELAVLDDYGYRYGWERFWGRESGPMTGVFVDQFEQRAGAGAYAEALARNDAELYGGVLSVDPPELPANCRLLTVDTPVPDAGLVDPAAFAWCWHGVFSVSVTAVAGSVPDAVREVDAVLEEQLALLPPA
ncbi:hypothetical protein E9549_00375 [Blastococcus sp. MG754426]|uniref:hypothetical protein n=1 Tax=unclassified Blastococcus TaxID=2619396 RepID=UPI001EF003D7|nr:MULTISPECIES: hypothetical protein [unclassified Blastococcus]MCF6505873.1 hypothetical protein [Blastococcus sp. MG754426]MCF6511047.1 hypothetical protein [Blastococcus sp. MG754427]